MEYFTFQNVLSDRTLFQGVRLLPPGSTMTVGPEGRARIERYWQFQFAPRRTGERYYADGVRERFEEDARPADERRPPGQLPLRGMDSGSICAVASRQILHLHTFTGGFHTPPA